MLYILSRFRRSLTTVLVFGFLCNAGLLQAQKDSSWSRLLSPGSLFFGVTGGVSVRESENEDLLVFKVLEQNRNGFNVFLSGGYFIRNHFAVGGALRFDQSRLSRTIEDADGIVTEIDQAGSIITTSASLKFMIPFTASNRINLYNIAGIAWVADRSVNQSFSQSVLTRTYTNMNSIQLGLRPGIQVFVIKGFATELGVDVAGLSGSRKRVTVNDVEGEAVNKLNLDLRINLLSVNLSFYYYFPIKKKVKS